MRKINLVINMVAAMSLVDGVGEAVAALRSSFATFLLPDCCDWGKSSQESELGGRNCPLRGVLQPSQFLL